MGHLFSPIKVVVLLEFNPNFPKVQLSLKLWLTIRPRGNINALIWSNFTHLKVHRNPSKIGSYKFHKIAVHPVGILLAHTFINSAKKVRKKKEKHKFKIEKRGERRKVFLTGKLLSSCFF